MPEHVINHDDLWPRDAAHRFRIYAVAGEDMKVLAATPTAEGIGTALITLHEDAKQVGRRLADEGRIGVLDVMNDGHPCPAGEECALGRGAVTCLHCGRSWPPDNDWHRRPYGDWIVLPWDRRHV